MALAMKIENHELLEFRRVAAALYKKNKRWAQSVSLSKADKMYKDAIDTAAESGDADLVEDLLRFFVSVQVRAVAWHGGAWHGGAGRGLIDVSVDGGPVGPLFVM